MPHHPDEDGSVVDDRLLVRPYVAPGGRPGRRPAPRRTGDPLWPQHDPAAVPLDRGTAGDLTPGDGTAAAPAFAPDRAPGMRPLPGAALPYVPPGGSARSGTPGAARRERGTRNALLALGLLALLTTGTLLTLLHSPPEDPPSPVGPPGVSAPGLLARSPGAGEPAASPTRSVRPSASAPSAGTGSAAPAPSRSAHPVAPASATPTPNPAASESAGDGTLRPGDSGAAVRALQERLFGQGFTYVSATGVYDNRTRRGVAQFQRDRGLTGDPMGVYGPRTRAALEGR
ncbi:peptidoglycan-binding protein [Streptomyces sp. NPDC006529]|uniref:peptidoglycan-binding domain-containing protein n=1 Tax=Streptomyces sp. NPDC006529 TaxID=3157177 RepID=UPI0033B92DE2